MIILKLDMKFFFPFLLIIRDKFTLKYFQMKVKLPNVYGDFDEQFEIIIESKQKVVLNYAVLWTLQEEKR